MRLHPSRGKDVPGLYSSESSRGGRNVPCAGREGRAAQREGKVDMPIDISKSHRYDTGIIERAFVLLHWSGPPKYILISSPYGAGTRIDAERTKAALKAKPGCAVYEAADSS